MKLPDHPSTQYLDQVLSGDIVTCKFTKLMCERHKYDWETSEKRGLYFDTDAADRVIRFYALCPHFKGEWAGDPIELELWQQFIISMIFGWKWIDTDFRRFKISYVTVARKNGKTTMIAPAGLYLMFADNEPGADVYSAAVDRDQAREIFDAAKAMVEMGPLANHIKTFARNMSVESTRSKFEPLSADEKKQHGKHIHAALCDELHVWPKASLWSVLRTGMGARRQPVQWAITTAGSDQSTICYEIHDYAQQILKGFKSGSFIDDTFFAAIYCLDVKKDWPDLKTKQESLGKNDLVEDDWTDQSVWIKANPNIGVSVKVQDLEDETRVALQMPTSQNDFLRLRMNLWTQQVTRWIDLDLWDKNFTRDIDESKLKGRRCTGGIDLSATNDLTTWVMLFPDFEIPDQVDILIRVWCTKDRLYNKKNKYRDQYQSWERDGFLTATEGNSIDYKFVRSTVLEDIGKYDIESIGVDRAFQGVPFCTDLIDDLGSSAKAERIFPVIMGPITMGPLMVDFERRLLEHQLNHGGNPILRWMADNVSVTEDSGGLKKPNKATSQGKIDGIIGILFALDRLMRADIKPKGNDGSLI